MFRSDRLVSPLIAIALIVAVVAMQQWPLLELRGVWWADEARHAAVLDEMVQHGEWLALHLNGQYYPDKPPIWFWLLGGFKALTGLDSAVVLFSGLAASVLGFALALWHMARQITGHTGVALLAVLVALSGSYFVFATHYARMDFLFSALIFLSWAAFFRAAGPQPDRAATLAGFGFAAVALLVKGPFGLALPLAAFVVHLGLNRRLSRLADRSTLAGLAMVAALGGLWLALLALRLGPDAVAGLLQGQVIDRAAKDGGPASNPLRYLIFLPLMLMPWTAVLLAPTRPFRALPCTPPEALGWLLAASLSGLAVLSAVGEKHEYYLLPLLGPVSILIAGSLAAMPFSGIRRVAIGGGLLLALPALALQGLLMAPGLLALDPLLDGLPAALRLPSLTILIAGLAVILAGGRLKALIGLVVVSQTAFATLALRASQPFLDPYLNPAIIAAPMRPLITQGHVPVVVHGIDGVFQHALGQRYLHLTSAANLWERLADTPHAVIALESGQWRDLPETGGRALGLIACPRFIGTHFILLATPPLPDTPPILPAAPCPAP